MGKTDPVGGMGASQRKQERSEGRRAPVTGYFATAPAIIRHRCGGPACGTGSMPVDTAGSSACSGIAPGRFFTCDSGAGNGSFGPVWSCSPWPMAHKADRVSPRHQDAAGFYAFLPSVTEAPAPVFRVGGRRRCKGRRPDLGRLFHRGRPVAARTACSAADGPAEPVALTDIAVPRSRAHGPRRPECSRVFPG